MTRSAGRIDCDSGYEDGMIDLSAADFIPTGATPAVLTRNAAGDISLNLAASLTGQFSCSLSKILFRTGLQDFVQERFGSGGASNNPFGGQGQNYGTPTTTSTASASAAGTGVAVNIAVKASGLFTVGRVALIDTGASTEFQRITAIPDATHITVAQLKLSHTTPFNISQGGFTTPAGVSGPSPFTGVTQFTQPTSRPKGVMVKGLELRYVVGTLALTSITVGLTKTVYLMGAAPVISNILAAGANGLTTTLSTNMSVLPVAIASPVYLTSDLSEYWLEIVAVTPATSTFKLYGATLYVTYNFN